MSDPAKSPREIEDVLASIRRLVSENNAAPAAVVANADPVPRQEDEAVGKLLLTPSQRVNDPDDPWAPVPRKPHLESASQRAPDAPAPDDAVDAPSWGLEDRLSDWGEIEGSADESVADAMAEQMADPYSDPGGAWQAQVDDPATPAETEGVATEFEPETGDADWPDRSAGSALRELALVRGRAGAVPQEDPGAKADTGGDEDATGIAGDDARDADTIQATAGDAFENAAADDDAEHSTAHDPDPEALAETETPMPHDNTEVTAERPEPPVFSRRPTVHRPDDETVETAPQDPASDHETGAGPTPDDEIDDLGEGAEATAFTFPEAEDGILDEDTLRDIIAEVVREELQGAMGQRITRNVRKMVRREIRLALAAEDLE